MYFKAKRLAKISALVLLVQIAAGFLIPWFLRDELMALGADEQGNL